MDEAKREELTWWITMLVGTPLILTIILSFPVLFSLWLAALAFLIYVLIEDIREQKGTWTVFCDFCWIAGLISLL